MPKVVVQVVQHLRPGGIETMALDLQGFSRPDDDVHIVSLEGDKEQAIAAWGRLAPVQGHLHFLGKPAGMSASTLITLFRLFRRLKATVVHTHHIGPLLYGGLAARLAGVRRIIHTEHDAWHLRSPRARRLQEILIIALRPILVADADAVADELRKIMPGRCHHVIANGIDTKRFSPGNKRQARELFGLPQGLPLIGCAARLEKVKGHEVLISALEQLPGNVHLALAGEGSREDELKTLTRKAGLADRVHFLGKVDAMPDFYRALDVFCLPSFSEGMPLSPLEAQACNVPCVLSDVGACRETLCPESGLLAAAGDSEGLALSLRQSLSVEPSRRPRSHIVERGDVRRMVSAYEQIHTA